MIYMINKEEEIFIPEKKSKTELGISEFELTFRAFMGDDPLARLVNNLLQIKARGEYLKREGDKAGTIVKVSQGNDLNRCKEIYRENLLHWK